MEINSIPEAFQTKIRIAIISSLITGGKSFKQLKQLTEATDGNLGAQLIKLEELKYINVKKQFIGRKPLSTYTLTKVGLDSFKEYVEMLEDCINQLQDE